MSVTLPPPERSNGSGPHSSIGLRQLWAPEPADDGPLPVKVMENIVARILDDPPFVTLSGLCQVCRLFRQIVFSKRYLVYIYSGNLHVFHCNSGRSWWETVSLQFLEDQLLPGNSMANLYIVFSEGGLLCLSTGAEGEYIFCNPLMQRGKRHSRRAGQQVLPRSVNDPVITTWLISALDSKPIAYRQYKSFLLDALIYQSDSLKMFALLVEYVTACTKKSGVVRRLNVVDIYKGNSNLVEHYDVSSMPTLITNGVFLLKSSGKRRVILGFHKRRDGPVMTFEYNEESRSCSRTESLASHHLQNLRDLGAGRAIRMAKIDKDDVVQSSIPLGETTGRNGKQVQHQSLISIFFMRRFSDSIGKAVHSSTTKEKNVRMQLIQFEEDDVTCWVSVLRTPLGRVARSVDYLSGMMLDAVNRERLWSEFTEWVPGVPEGVDDYNILVNFRILRPRITFTFDRIRMFERTGFRFPLCEVVCTYAACCPSGTSSAAYFV